MTEQPSEDPVDEPEGDEPPSTEEPERPGRIPPADPDVREIDKRFMVGDGGDEPPLRVTLRGGSVATRYAPVELVAQFGDRIGKLLRDLGGGFKPMLYGVLPGSSMVLLFGDPIPEEPQEVLPIEFTLPHARRIADLIAQEDAEELYRLAVQIGRPALRYNDLTQLVESEGVTVEWAPRDTEPQLLTPARARRQHTRLSADPPTVEREILINGRLYRVIAEPREGRLGTVGIHPFNWSARLPGMPKQATIIAEYENADVEKQIKGGLIGDPVEATLRIQAPAPGSSIDPDRVRKILVAIRKGPGEHSIYGSPMFDEDE